MKIPTAFIALMMIVAFGCVQQGPIVGNDTDEHGCIGSAGYSWCEEKQKCLRIFEENCTKACTAEAKICPDGTAVGRTGPDCEFAPCPQLVGNDSDEHGCIGSAGYAWCELRQSCLREWEEPCQLSLEEALSAAWGSECMQEGNVSGADAIYNNNSKTWWLGLDADKPGCSPACVVYENRSVEINWRCTGLIPPYTIKVANSSLGEILTDGDGMSLYVFTADSYNETTCYGTCELNWPPLHVTDTIAVQKGLPGEIGAILRNDSTLQATYNSMPLYTYAPDKEPGDVFGQGVGGKWFVAAPDMDSFPS